MAHESSTINYRTIKETHGQGSQKQMATHLFKKKSRKQPVLYPCQAHILHTLTNKSISQGGRIYRMGAAKSKVTLSQLGWIWCVTLFCDKTSSNTFNTMLALLYPLLPNYPSCSSRELFLPLPFYPSLLCRYHYPIKYFKDLIYENASWCQRWSNGTSVTF